MSDLSDPNSLHVCSLTSLLISDSSLHISALVDSGSTHCFVDTNFVQYYKLPTYPVDPIELKLFDGTSNSVITQSIALPVKFLSGECMNVNFYVTLLDLSTPPSISDMPITSSALQMVMNGKPLSTSAMVPLNGLLCHLDSPMLLQLSNDS